MYKRINYFVDSRAKWLLALFFMIMCTQYIYKTRAIAL